jgi:protein-tyrosine phosphatase
LAEALLADKIKNAGLEHIFAVDSAGTSGQHTGEMADPRTRKNAEMHGISILHRARKFSPSDFEFYDIILTMDKANLRDVLNLARNESDRLKTNLLLQFVGNQNNLDVPDPWYGDEQGFEQVFNILDHACTQLFDSLIKNS